ncbi:MAG: FliI/YscN family ATPase [Spirochaetes bacterium]|jgi:flagellum-specific ATP synthase|nr:FliI/YscN family ATPase [Spirochaetota bacterium]
MIRVLPHEKVDILSKYFKVLEEVDCVRLTGFVDKIQGLSIESVGPNVRFGDVCKIMTSEKEYIYAEVVGFKAKDRPLLMPIGDMQGVLPGADVISLGTSLMAPVGDEILGRIIDGIGMPIDGKGPIITGQKYPIDGTPVNPLQRHNVEAPLSTGIRAIDGLMTVGRGQRIGIFSGSGVGKSTTLGMIARYTDADINVIALIGERGREVRDFVYKELGEEGLKRSVVIVATSDQPPMMRIRGAYLAHAIAEYFRDQGKDVNLLLDSITRFAMAQREKGLAAGEPSASKGYPPSVFNMLARMMERSGSGINGSISAFYTVLIEADDMNDPIADAVRGILDGHIILDRAIANKGHYPAIDVLASLSRCMKDVTTPEHQQLAQQLRELMAAYKDVEDMVMLNTYARGTNLVADRAINMINDINAFLRQKVEDESSLEKTVALLHALLDVQPSSRTRRSDYVSSVGR